jgi:hypothetical protein
MIVLRAAVLVGNLGGPVVFMASASAVVVVAVVVMVRVGVDAVLAVPLIPIPTLPLDLVNAVLAGLTNGIRELDQLQDVLLFISLAMATA